MKPYYLICGAVQAEIAGLVELLDERVCARLGNKPHYSGNIFGLPVQVIETGVGAVNISQALTAAIEREMPDLIIQVGCAGLFRETGLNIGDIAIALEEIDVELGVESAAGFELPVELPFPVLTKNGKQYTHRYPLAVDESGLALRLINETCSSQGFKAVAGTFITVSTVTASSRRAEQLYAAYRPCMESMEGAGAALLALMYGLPLVEIRAASNYTGPRERHTWRIELACERAAMAAAIFVKGLAANS